VKTLMVRQVRLLATPALVSMALGLFPLVGLSLSDVALTASPAEVALALVAIVAPWLIAVAAIAPDAESGGLAFLGGLPLGRGRHFALRALVGVGWSLVVTAPFFALCARELSRHQFEDYAPVMVVFASLAFVAGLAAGAVARQSLAAFVAAPLLLLVPLGLYGAFLTNLRAPTEFFLAAPIVASVLLVVAGWLGFRDPAVSSWRPLVRTVGLLLGAVALGCGVTTAAWARALVFPSWTHEWGTQGSVLLRFSREEPDWPSADRGWNTTVYPVAALERVSTLDELAEHGEGWTFDQHLRVLAITAEGHVLAQASYAQLLLLDLEQRKVLARVEPTRVLWPNNRGLIVDEPIRLAPGAPWFVDVDRTVRALGGEVLHQLPVEASLEATGGARLVATLPDGKRILVDVTTGARTLLDVADDGYVVLSPSGRHLTQWAYLSRVNGLTFRDLDGGRDVTLPFPDGGRPLYNVSMSFAPDDRTVLVTWSALADEPADEYDASTIVTEDHIAAVDLVSGAVTELPAAAGWITAWAPGGRRFVTHDGWIDLDDQPTLFRPFPVGRGAVCRFVDDDTVLCSIGGKIERIELGR
jgi:hypothetical protein